MCLLGWTRGGHPTIMCSRGGKQGRGPYGTGYVLHVVTTGAEVFPCELLGPLQRRVPSAPSGTTVIDATATAYTAVIANDGAAVIATGGVSEHPGAIGDLAAPTRFAILFPDALAFAVATIVVNGSSLLRENATLDAR